MNRSDAENGAKAQYPAVEALQDIASQLAQLMHILKEGEPDNGKEESSEQKSG